MQDEAPATKELIVLLTYHQSWDSTQEAPENGQDSVNKQGACVENKGCLKTKEKSSSGARDLGRLERNYQGHFGVFRNVKVRLRTEGMFNSLEVTVSSCVVFALINVFIREELPALLLRTLGCTCSPHQKMKSLQELN